MHGPNHPHKELTSTLPLPATRCKYRSGMTSAMILSDTCITHGPPLRLLWGSAGGLFWFTDLCRPALDLAAVSAPLGSWGMVLPAGVALAMFANIQRSFAPTHSSRGRTMLLILYLHILETGCCRLVCHFLCLQTCRCSCKPGPGTQCMAMLLDVR